MTETTDPQPVDRLEELRTEYAQTGRVMSGGAVWLISQVVVLREQVQRLRATPAVPAPATDQAALRDRIAAAIIESDGVPSFEFAAKLHRAAALREADAVLSVLPAPADRAELKKQIDLRDYWHQEAMSATTRIIELEGQLEESRRAAVVPADRATARADAPVKQRADCTETEWAEQERARFERLYTRESARADLAEQRADTAARDADIYQRRLERLSDGYTKQRQRAEAMERAMEATAADALAHRGCHRELMAQCLRAERAEAEADRLRTDRAAEFTAADLVVALRGAGAERDRIEAQAPTADRAAIRDRIAMAIEDAPYRHDGTRRAWQLADAVLAVLPAPADRAAILRAADLIDERADDLWAPGTKANAEMRADADALRRMAGEAQQPETQAEEIALLRLTVDAVEEGRRELRAENARLRAQLWTLASMLDGLHTLIATSSRDWQTYRVDAWIWAVLCGWDCEQAEHDETCTHGALEETAAMHGWDDDTVARARRYRAVVHAITEPAAVSQPGKEA